MSKKHSFNILMESEFEKAEIAMAVQNITDTLQKQAEQLSKIKIEQVPAISGRIKAEVGLEESQAFTNAIIPAIDSALDATMQAKEAIDTEKLKITGDIDGASDIEVDVERDIDTDLGSIDAELEGEADVDLDVELADGAEEDLLGGDEDLGGMEEVSRELKAESIKTSKKMIKEGKVESFAKKIEATKRKLRGKPAKENFGQKDVDKLKSMIDSSDYSAESNQMRDMVDSFDNWVSSDAPFNESKQMKCKVIVESVKGKIGSKTFNTLEEGKSWTMANAKHIKAVKNILPVK